MESTTCVFNPVKGGTCKSLKRTSLSMLMCQKHLRDYFGLEMGYHQEDLPSMVALVGGYLQPVKNMAHFKRMTVIIPTKNFFDRTFRSEYFESEPKYREYQMNPIIIENVNKYGINAGKSLENRLVIEIYRNLMHLKSDPVPNQETHLHDLLSAVRVNKKNSESYIEDQSIYKTLKDNYINIEDVPVPINDPKLEFSLSIQYMLYNCTFSELQIDHAGERFSDYVTYNCEFVEDIGLVATEMINWPHPLIVNGYRIGSQTFYNSKVTLVKKEIVQKNYTLKDIPPQYAVTNALKSGTMC